MIVRYTFLILLLSISFIIKSQTLNLKVDSAKVGQFIPLYDIYFEFNSPNLLDSNQLELNMIVDYLIMNKNVHIEIGVHTGFRGSDKYNLKMSKKRAITLKEYLVSKRIGKNRINAIGFGETKPVIEYEDWTNFYDTHVCGYYLKSNRRITVVITKI